MTAKLFCPSCSWHAEVTNPTALPTHDCPARRRWQIEALTLVVVVVAVMAWSVGCGPRRPRIVDQSERVYQVVPRSPSSLNPVSSH